jgi:phosphoribosyl-ATP pyrophosphohydrolase
MGLYTGRFSLADCLAATLRSDRADGLWPTVVADEHGTALGLAWSSGESLARALETGTGIYHSRKRGLWRKGGSSGATQELLRVDADCDRDVLRFVVRQAPPGFCHRETWSCFGDAGGLPALARTIAARLEKAPPGSYTRRLLDDPALLRAKLAEEAAELAGARGSSEAAHEAGDLLYFALVTLARENGTLADVERELDRRALRVTRRPGNAKTTETDR